jgi:hypothetical protein
MLSLLMDNFSRVTNSLKGFTTKTYELNCKYIVVTDEEIGETFNVAFYQETYLYEQSMELPLIRENDLTVIYSDEKDTVYLLLKEEYSKNVKKDYLEIAFNAFTFGLFCGAWNLHELSGGMNHFIYQQCNSDFVECKYGHCSTCLKESTLVNKYNDETFHNFSHELCCEDNIFKPKYYDNLNSCY